MKKVLRKGEQYCLENYGRVWTAGETNERNPEFAKLPLEDCIDIIKHTWTIDFEEEDDIALKTGSIRQKLKVIVYRWICLRQVGKAYTDDFVDMIFDVAVPFVVIMGLLLFATYMSCMV